MLLVREEGREREREGEGREGEEERKRGREEEREGKLYCVHVCHTLCGGMCVLQ
jgi:hypothetical protein